MAPRHLPVVPWLDLIPIAGLSTPWMLRLHFAATDPGTAMPSTERLAYEVDVRGLKYLLQAGNRPYVRLCLCHLPVDGCRLDMAMVFQFHGGL